MRSSVIITGANGNLGSAVVENLFLKGYTIYAVTGQGPIPEAFAEKVKGMQQVNLMDETETARYVGEITAQTERIQAAILLVGGFAMGGIEETFWSDIEKQVNLNVKTAYGIIKPLLPYFEKKGGGQFILVGARPALDPGAGKDLVAYSLSKSLIFQLADIVNKAGKGKHITASVIVPSIIDTPSNRASMPESDFTKWVKASDIAESIAFLLSSSGATLRESVLKIYNES